MRRIDEGGIDGDLCCVVSSEDLAVVCLVWPTAAKLKQLKQLSEDKRIGQLLVVNPQAPVHSVKELIDYLKADLQLLLYKAPRLDLLAAAVRCFCTLVRSAGALAHSQGGAAGPPARPGPPPRPAWKRFHMEARYDGSVRGAP